MFEGIYTEPGFLGKRKHSESVNHLENKTEQASEKKKSRKKKKKLAASETFSYGFKHTFINYLFHHLIFLTYIILKF